MPRLRTEFLKLTIIALAALGSLAAGAVPASAYLVCNRWGYCWHVHRHHYYYPAYYYYRDPYYDPYYYSYGPYYGPPYGGPYYYGYGPSVSFGFNFGGGHHWH